MEDALSVRSHSLLMEIVPTLSGRVRTLAFQGRPLLSGADINSTNWGATYWTSPQADWGWPPPASIDGEPYEVLAQTGGISLMSPLVTLGERVFVIEKHFRPGPHDSTIDTKYVIENRGTSAFRMASWEISRVPAGGLTFYPTGEREVTPIAPHSFMDTQKVGGTTFYDHLGFTGGKCLKLHADGSLGYLAHVIDGMLILKLFADTPSEQQAPGEGECEIFANEDGLYVEIEVQGSYSEIQPGGRHAFEVRTAVCELPPGLGRENLLGLRAFADERARFLS